MNLRNSIPQNSPSKSIKKGLIDKNRDTKQVSSRKIEDKNIQESNRNEFIGESNDLGRTTSSNFSK